MTSVAAEITLATRITLLRILGVPVFVVLLVYYLSGLRNGVAVEGYRLAALFMFLGVAATDALDGYLARKRGEVSRLGAILDPIADKTLMITGLILLTAPSLEELQPQIPLWFTVLVISREVFLVAGALLVRYFVREVVIRPRLVGKVATLLQILVIAWVLAQVAPAWFFPAVLAAGLFTAVSWALYLVDGVRQLEQAHRTSS